MMTFAMTTKDLWMTLSTLRDDILTALMTMVQSIDYLSDNWQLFCHDPFDDTDDPRDDTDL